MWPTLQGPPRYGAGTPFRYGSTACGRCRQSWRARMSSIRFASVGQGHPYLESGHWFFHEGEWVVCASAGQDETGRWAVQLLLKKHHALTPSIDLPFTSLADAKDYVAQYFGLPVVDGIFPEPSNLEQRKTTPFPTCGRADRFSPAAGPCFVARLWVCRFQSWWAPVAGATSPSSSATRLLAAAPALNSLDRRKPVSSPGKPARVSVALGRYQCHGHPRLQSCFKNDNGRDKPGHDANG